MKVKGGGGRRKSWEETPAMPVVDDAVVQDTSSNPNAPFALLLPQALAATQPQPQDQAQEQEEEEEQEQDRIQVHNHQEPQVLEEGDHGDSEGEGDGEGEGEGEGDVDVDGDGDGEAEAEADGVDDENAERTKLAEGFYEIEAVRRKRVRKGQLQYLIKWRGWPETANTWEPLENLQSISDVIDAFEESLRTGKHRRRKRKSGILHTQPKKRQQRSTVPIYNVTDVEISIADKYLSSSALNCSSLDDVPPLQQSMGLAHDGENNGHVNNIETAKKVDADNWCANASQQFGERREENEYDPKLSELKATISTNIVNSDKLSVHFQEGKASEVNGPTDSLSKVDCAEPVQSTRSTGAKRRKSGSVKRFKQETHLSELGAAQNATSRVSVRYGGRVNQSGAENLDYAGENSSRRNKIDESKNALRITKIIKPIGYSASVSNNVQDVSVSFMAMRSDGAEVVVDNKFLKVNNPLLLISFYEQHLRYSPTM